MNPWDELFQGQVADEFSSMLAADFSNSLHAAGEEKKIRATHAAALAAAVRKLAKRV